MLEKWYECLVETETHRFNVNVFTGSDDKEVIKVLATDRAKQILEEFGIDYRNDDIQPIGFKEIEELRTVITDD